MIVSSTRALESARLYAYWSSLNYVAVHTNNKMLLDKIQELSKKRPNFIAINYGRAYLKLKGENPTWNASKLRNRALDYCIGN